MAVKIGFIGAGGNAAWHMGSLKNIKDAELKAVADIAFEKAKKATDEHGGTPYASHKAMLEAEDLDCVYISIQPYQHGEPEIDVIQKGLPFFVEKPLATTMPLAEDILDRVKKRNIGTCVGYQIRYLDIVDKVKEMLADTFINAVNAHYVCGAIGGWYTRMALSGGQVTEQATHLIDLMRFILGDVAWVAGSKRQGAKVSADTLDATVLGKGSADSEAMGLDVHEYNIWDATSLLMQFESGVPATFMCSCQVPYTWDVLFDIFTPDFRLKLTFEKLEVIRKVDGELKTELVEPDGTANIDASFVNAVKTGDWSGIRSNYEDGVKSLAVSIAAIEAAKTGTIVPIG